MENQKPTNFIRDIIDSHNQAGRFGGAVHTRFPPEPNGYPHIGHAKSICINFGIARDYNGTCNLRMDDTNPEKEEMEYVNALINDVHWLGFDWGKNLFYASDYFQKIYEYAIELIKADKAYVCDLSPDEFKECRGTVTRAGKDSPYRKRSPEENRDLFERMRKGEFEDGTRVLRGKIDMTSPNMLMRDPVFYRIKREHHHRTGDNWCIYPMYDFAHCLSDSIEGITHSICTLEFENNRPLYDWILDALKLHHPQQIEFARLNLSNTVLSKRKLLQLVEDKRVSGWDDPRMPTLSGLRRRGYTPSSIRSFCDEIGVAKMNSIVAINVLENSVRNELNKTAMRAMAVLKPIKLIITNYPADKTEELDAVNNPEDPSTGTRKVPFSRELYIERDDFREVPPPKFFRLTPGREVRLRYAYFVKCTDVVKDAKTGEVTEVHCTYDPATRGGDAPDGRKVKATIHWVSALHAVEAEVRVYDYLFSKRDPEDVPEGVDFRTTVNPNSLEIIKGAKLEPSLKSAQPGNRYQFERLGYFFIDPAASIDGKNVYNRIVSLKDTWAKTEAKQ
ncbi:MAG: glutamine--tRNA ligase/YqeY domain fusion protein [Candidatus Omnitrophota bacterium]|jgi:glutaminyl-tRNA synthetase